MTRNDPRRGAVLVAVLWSISLLAALAMAASVTFRSFTGVMGVDRHRVERDALITAGLEVAAGAVLFAAMFKVLPDAPVAWRDAARRTSGRGR